MKILDLAVKDLKRATRNLFLLGMAVAAPLLICTLMYFPLRRQQVEAVPAPVNVGVVNEDVPPSGAAPDESLGGAVEAMLDGDEVRSWISVTRLASPEAAEAALEAKRIGVAVLIPAGFTADFLGSQPSEPVTILRDPTLIVGPEAVRDMVRSLLDGVISGRVAHETLSAYIPSARLSEVVARYVGWYAELQRGLAYGSQTSALVVAQPGAPGNGSVEPVGTMMSVMMVGQIAFFAIHTGAYFMISLLQEDEQGTLARLFTTPTSRTVILGGKFVAVTLTVLLQGLVLLAAGRLLFGVDWGQPLPVAIALASQVIVASGLGVPLISLVRTTAQAGVVLGGVLTALGMLGGLFTANLTMPAGFRALAQFIPQGRVIALWRAVISGAATGEVIGQALVTAALGAVLFAAGAVIFRRRYS